MKIFFGLAYIAIIIYLLYKYLNPYANYNIRNGMNPASVSENIDRLNRLCEQLQEVEELISDISLCSPKGHHKSVSFEWTSTSGKKKQYNIWVDGQCQNTKDILNFAYSERDRLRSSLRSETRKLSQQCKGNQRTAVKIHQSRKD